MRILTLAIVSLSFCMAAESQFLSPTFTIDAPTGTGTGLGTVAVLLLPQENNFSGNVNVQIQEYAGTINEYNNLSQEQIKKANFSLVESKIGADEMTIEYTGKTKDMEYHWYSKAFKVNNKIYLITATGLEVDWANQKTALIESVNSFKLKP